MGGAMRLMQESCPGAGVYRAKLSLHLVTANQSSVNFHFPEDEEAPLWTIVDQTTVQSFVLPIDGAALEAAIQARQD